MSAQAVIPAASSLEMRVVLGQWFLFPADVGAEEAPAAARARLTTTDVSSHVRQAQ